MAGPGYLHQGWEPLRRVDDQPNFDRNPAQAKLYAAAGLTPEDEVWLNNRYQVLVRYSNRICDLCKGTGQMEVEGEDAFARDQPGVTDCSTCNGEGKSSGGREGLLHLSLHTHDRGPVRNWRHLQQIKNEVAGEDRWAVEIFPPEDQLVDTSNEYHIWVMPEGSDLPFGMHDGRLVSSDRQVEEYNAEPHKGQQEPWEPGLGGERPDSKRLDDTADLTRSQNVR